MIAALALCALAVGAPLERGALERAAAYSAAHHGLALIVSQRGNILLERYDNGARAGDRNRIASIVKSFWALAAAIAVEKKILSWDERAADTLEAWRADPRRSAIEIHHLLTMTSGLDPGYARIDDSKTADKYAEAVKLPAVAAPGAVFTYGPANMAAFGAIFRKKTPPRFFREHVLGPLHITSPWATDLAGNPMTAAGVALTARELLSLGKKVLDRHIAPLLVGTTINPMYGTTFWLNANAAQVGAIEVDVEASIAAGPAFDWQNACFSRAAPADLVVMLGSWGQRVYVVPSRELVIVRQGSAADLKDAELLGLLFR